MTAQASRRVRGTAGQSGQALTELAIVIVPVVMLMLGIVEFGRAWMITNWVTQTARDGARAAAVAPASDRDPVTHIITNAAKTQIETKINNELDAIAGDGGTTLTGSLDPTAVVDGIPVVQVTISGTVDYIFYFLSATGFEVSRTATFRDEGR